MPKKLLITEKPSVAMQFAKALKIETNRKNGYLENFEWIITWCVGHLVTMSYPEVYDKKLKFWRLDTLPFIPKDFKYEVIPNVQNQFNIIKELLTRQDVDTIYVSTDSGREGEYIYRLVDQMIGVDGKIKKRVWIDSQTEEEILRGIKEAKDLSEYDSLSDAAYLRAKEDYLIGINFSRLLTITYGKRVASMINEDKASISIGRVMTCVLGMIVSREREIRDFVKNKYYKISADFDEFTAEWKRNSISKLYSDIDLYNDVGFKNKEKAEEVIAYLKEKDATVEEVKKTKQKENAPLLFNLAEIQNECTKRFKIKPDETLEIIQSLYEKKLVTYPRTDARVLSTAVAKEISKNLNGLSKNYKDVEIQGYISKMIAEKYSTNLIKTKYVNDSKITDHYAIIPTGQGLENLDKLPDLQKNIYKLIVKRFLAIFFSFSEFSKVAVTLKIDEETFTANEKICLNKGYLEVLKQEDSAEPAKEILKTLRKGQIITPKEIIIKEAETVPPTRYNSGSIILAMENAGKLIEDEALREQIKGVGIGTSATRAEIIKKLEKIHYIDINAKTQIITPTKKGEIIFDVVNSSMPDMLNPKLTASWEKGLEMVANKEIKDKEFMTKLENYIKSKFKKIVYY